MGMLLLSNSHRGGKSLSDLFSMTEEQMALNRCSQFFSGLL
eukprot:NODE_9054_length_233_cov_52.880435_g8439_i0.p1 GENE.NODE_9054_length_233_cov_52.880435_g8439_i0~~NODE_9054_length_233_cov_52.880435_g8439_i0.p1  ORF type:complete len:51 (-),score=25.51 NODE_9054_length_233_cov_52.880435_g8439_i0:79-201(-)